MSFAALQLFVRVLVCTPVAQMLAQRLLRPRLRALDRVIRRARMDDEVYRQLAPADQLVDVRIIRRLRRSARIRGPLHLQRNAQRADVPEVQIRRELTCAIDLRLASRRLVIRKLPPYEAP